MTTAESQRRREPSDKPLIIIGAGPAGLSAAHEAVHSGMTPHVIEKSCRVGGISRTESYKDYHFDIGGHRFFTKFSKINDLWSEVMGNDFLDVDRMSRIFYRDRFFTYPLNLMDTLLKMGILESLGMGLSYLKAQLSTAPEVKTFEQWVTNRFGRRLYRAFFKSYTEKVWGIPCAEIRADWAAQRIQDLSLMKALTNALFGNSRSKTLIEAFKYPVLGPGMMWERLASAIQSEGGIVHRGVEATRFVRSGSRIENVVCRMSDGTEREFPADHVLSTIPITELVKRLDPAAPKTVMEAASNLSYRAFIIVMLLIDARDLFPDQWIYIHSPRVAVGRIQNFKNWSPAMVPDPEKTSVGMEYFCNKDDDIWRMADDRLVEMAANELALLGLGGGADIIDSYVVRQPYAYPVYDRGYAENLEILKKVIHGIDNLQTMGRNGMHRYNNMDHSMLTGILAVKNITGECHDLWRVNDDEDYLEEEKDGPGTLLSNEKILKTFARIDKTAFSLAAGLTCGMAVFLATIWLVIKGGPVIGPNLMLLGQYFFHYSVSVKGAFWGLVNGFLWGAVIGGAVSFVRNFVLACYIIWIRKKYEVSSFRDFFDHI